MSGSFFHGIAGAPGPVPPFFHATGDRFVHRAAVGGGRLGAIAGPRGIAVAIGMALLPGPVTAQAVLDAPSGQSVTLYQVVLEEEAQRARFLFLAPGIALEEGAGLIFDDVMEDFSWLCQRVILPALDENGWAASQVVIAMSNSEIAFGERDAAVVQFFEAFTVEDGACVLEVF